VALPCLPAAQALRWSHGPVEESWPSPFSFVSPGLCHPRWANCGVLSKRNRPTGLWAMRLKPRFTPRPEGKRGQPFFPRRPPWSRRRDLGHDDRAFKGASKQTVGQTIVDVRAATAGALVFVGAAGDFVSVLLEVRTLFPRIE
jgi:hypothetical protein